MDLNRLIAGIAQSGVASGLAGGVAGGALTGALMSKKGRKHAKTALALGGLAAVGGLAWKAYQGYRDGQPGAAPPTVRGGSSQATPDAPSLARSDFDIDAANEAQGSRGLLLVRAMVAAAGADGHIDADERARIFARVGTLDLSAQEKGLLFDELSHPASLDELAAGADNVETAAEIYAASLLAMDSTRAEGRFYLEALAARLHLPESLVGRIHAEAEAHARVA